MAPAVVAAACHAAATAFQRSAPGAVSEVGSSQQTRAGLLLMLIANCGQLRPTAAAGTSAAVDEEGREAGAALDEGGV